MFRANNIFDTIILIAVIVVVVSIVFGIIGGINTVNWKKHLEVGQSTVYGDELFLVLERNYKSSDYFVIQSITIKVTPSSGLPFKYTFEPERRIGPGRNESFYISCDDIFNGKDNSVREFKVTSVKLTKADK